MVNTVKIIEQNSEFFASGRPSLIQIHGESDQHQESLSIENENLNGTVSVDLNTFHTGMRFRDRHLYSKVFDVEKFPVATLKLQALPMTATEFKGSLEFHGTQKALNGTQKFEKSGSDWIYRIEFKLNMSEFGIVAPEFLGMKMNPEVRIQVTGKLH